jgi:hypothetical protein
MAYFKLLPLRLFERIEVNHENPPGWPVPIREPKLGTPEVGKVGLCLHHIASCFFDFASAILCQYTFVYECN